ncbi:ataxin-3 isoform X2 [Rhinatrema bivittatum]|uniref:ataxin-3 isoform X2 n=1 Tax=Rhinatrema bivittatum TaxID=194408 RepID=UPI00112B9983|nr:ataxin-3 isoform X2 [Rhinatrema bivittatum]
MLILTSVETKLDFCSYAYCLYVFVIFIGSNLKKSSSISVRMKDYRQHETEVGRRDKSWSAQWREKQEGSLCAQHCLNNLLQGEYFSPVELSSIAHQLDEEERMRMAEGGLTSDEYRTFLQPSGNMDDSGYFSIQVISNALKVWGLELTLFNSPEYQRLLIDPINERAFICNYKEHWFTIRKLGKQWFNLNSLLTGPELISDTYLALFLAQLQQEGYSIFVVKGDLPDCEADQLLHMIRAKQIQRPRLIGEDVTQPKGQREQKGDLEQILVASTLYDGTRMLDEDEENLQKALALSRHEIDMEDEEADLRRAIQLSMQGGPRSEPPETALQDIPPSVGPRACESLSSEELRRRRQIYFDKQQQAIQKELKDLHDKPTTSSNALGIDPGEDMNEDDMLQAAMNMSLEPGRNYSKAAKKK